MGQKFMFEESFLGWNFNFDHEKKLTFFSMVTTIRGGEKNQPKPQRTPATKQDQNTPQKPLIGIKANW